MSIDGTYAISAQVGKKGQEGTLVVRTEGDVVNMTLSAPVVGKLNATGTAGSNDTFTASGSTRVLLKRITYTVDARVDAEGILTADCDTSMGKFAVVGKRTGA